MLEIVKNGDSRSTQNVAVSAIKKFYSKIYNKNLDIDQIERPRGAKKLPKVISSEVIELMLASMSNIKHKTALLLIYGLGLRRGELIRLKLQDIDSRRLQVNIRDAKGNKDRTIPVSQVLMNRIIQYYRIYKPEIYLIEGDKPGKPYSATSLQKIFERNIDKMLPGNNFTLHCLRHSCATHILESGTDIRYIKELLGHKSTKTTEIYTHVTMKSLRKIPNPGDNFNI